jgi:hypothetical protein
MQLLTYGFEIHAQILLVSIILGIHAIAQVGMEVSTTALDQLGWGRFRGEIHLPSMKSGRYTL